MKIIKILLVCFIFLVSCSKYEIRESNRDYVVWDITLCTEVWSNHSDPIFEKCTSMDINNENDVEQFKERIKEDRRIAKVLLNLLQNRDK